MRILLLVNGLGLGNSTRCHAIIENLVARSCHCEIVTSGNGIWYFKDVAGIERIHEAAPLYYGRANGKLSIGKTIGAIPDFIRIMQSNGRALESVLDTMKPHAVVTDSIYSFKAVKRRGIPLISLNNADVVVVTKRQHGPLPAPVQAHYHFVEYLDYLFNKTVPDAVLSPSLAPDVPLLHPRVRRIGPIVRKGITPVADANSPAALIMLSGSVFGTHLTLSNTQRPYSIDVVGRDAPAEAPAMPGVTFHGRLHDSRHVISRTNLAVVNGGFSAVSEMFCRRCPIVVVPVPGHAEQWANANAIERLGVGLSSTEEELESKLTELAARAPEFRRAYDNLPPPEDGAAQAAEIILEIARS